MHRTKNSRRPAFTLVELLVVITILMILSTLVFAVFGTGRNSDKTRSAARIGQSAFLGAKDRALHAKDLRGIRLIRDNNGPTFASGTYAIANGFVYLQPLPMQTYGQGSIQLERIDLVDVNGNPPGDGIADSTPITIVHGFDSSSPVATPPATAFVDWVNKSIFFHSSSRIRIPSGTGQWYQFGYATSGVYQLTTGNEYLTLTTGYNGTGTPFPAVVAYDRTSTLSSCDISLGNDLLPFHQPITLPSGVIIDLATSSANVQVAASTSATLDIMFSPRGAVSGVPSGSGPMHFMIRGLKDATAGNNPWAVGPAGSANPDLNQEDRLILTVVPQTGLVQVFEIDPTDNFTNPSLVAPINLPGTGAPDGIADNLFNFAQQGKSAGR